MVAKKKNEMSEETVNTGVEGMDLGGIPDDADLVSENVGFDPYWEPGENERMYGSVVGWDAADPEFIRITFIAEAPVRCFKGPKDDQEEVIVQKGERYNMSSYVQLEKLFAEYLDYAAEGILIPIVVKAEGFSDEKSRKTGKPWRLWSVQVTKDTRAMLNKLRSNRAKNLSAAKAGHVGQLVGKDAGSNAARA